MNLPAWRPRNAGLSSFERLAFADRIIAAMRRGATVTINSSYDCQNGGLNVLSTAEKCRSDAEIATLVRHPRGVEDGIVAFVHFHVCPWPVMP